MGMRRLIIAALSMAIPGIAFAGTPATVPEPETIALIGVGAVALLVARWLRKK